MSKKDDYEKKAEELIIPLINKNNFDLVDTEYVREGGNYYLRYYIDKENGINVDDCELISRAVSDLLDKEDFIEDSYILEVSSPGLLRPLKKPRDFERSIGRQVEIKLYKAMDKKKDFEGTLTGFTDSSVTISADGEEITFDREKIALIRLAFDF